MNMGFHHVLIIKKGSLTWFNHQKWTKMVVSRSSCGLDRLYPTKQQMFLLGLTTVVLGEPWQSHSDIMDSCNFPANQLHEYDGPMVISMLKQHLECSCIVFSFGVAHEWYLLGASWELWGLMLLSGDAERKPLFGSFSGRGLPVLEFLCGCLPMSIQHWVGITSLQLADQCAAKLHLINDCLTNKIWRFGAV